MKELKKEEIINQYIRSGLITKYGEWYGMQDNKPIY